MKQTPMRGATALLCAIILHSLCLSPAQATLTKLRDFSTAYADGAYPVGKTVLTGGNVYGVTEYGSTGYGSVYKMTTAGAVTTIYDFNSAVTSPRNPNAGLILVGTKLYGTGFTGGANNKGCVFEITTAGTLTIRYSFGATATDADRPAAGLIYNSADGFLYGTTLYGGAKAVGTIYKIMPDGTNYSVIKEFDNAVDCYYPRGTVCLGPDGKLWGTTYDCKGFYGGVYKINTDGTGYTFVYGFGSTDTRGNRPLCDLVKGNDGKLYGSCIDSGPNNMGTLFSIDTSNNLVSLVWAFDGYTGAEPGFAVDNWSQYALTVASGTSTLIYGVTRYGGYYGYGTVFKLDTATGIVSLVTSLTLTTANGRSNPLTQNGSTLIGTSYWGGATATTGPDGNLNGWGSAFSCTTSGTLKLLHTFYIRDGYTPDDSPTASIAGYLYGTTYDGGAYGTGAIYKINATTKAYTVLHSFNNYWEEGTSPIGGLIKASDGALYGCTYTGGRFGNGTIYKITTAGLLTVIHHFRGALEGWDAYRKLVQGYGNDKNLYGVCYQGGVSGYGSIFKCDTAGKNFQVIHYFGGPDGQYPGCTLAVEPDTTNNTTKWLYGTTYQGGANSVGTLYRINSNGSSFTKLKDFSTAIGAGAYYNGPILLISGVLYGESYTGGASSHGALWKYVIATDALTNVFSFNNNSPGYQGYLPVGGLSTDGSGVLYGMCRQGGTAGYGTIWKYNLGTNTYTKLHDFVGTTGGGDGAYPYGGATYDSALGLLFGTTSNGGVYNYGTIFSQTLTP